MSRKIVLMVVALFCVSFILSSCATTISNVQRDELTRAKAKNADVKVKDPTTATILGILPGGASFYTSNWGPGVWSFLTWPLSILWEVPLGGGAAEYRNWEETVIKKRADESR